MTSTTALLVDAIVGQQCDAVYVAKRDSIVVAAERLHARLAKLLAPIARSVGTQLADGGVPSDVVRARALLAVLDDVKADLIEALVVETADIAVATVEHVDDLIAAASKAAGPLDALRPLGMDKALFNTMSRLGGRLLDRFRDRAVELITTSARDQVGGVVVRDLIASMLDAELGQLTRHVVGDVRSEVTEAVEQARGIRFHQWVTAGDELVREAHAAVDGEIVEVGERFSNGWRRPGGVGCRCELQPIVTPQAA